MLNRVVIKNFKSIGEGGVDLELKPLTLLVGPNGGGKSSILEAIAVASQRDHAGKLTNFPSWGSVCHRPNGTAGVVELHALPVGGELKPGYKLGFAATGTISTEGLTPGLNLTVQSSSLLQELPSKTFLLSSVRGNVPYSEDTSGDPQWVGVNGEDLLLLLAAIFGQRRHRGIENSIIRWASRFGITDLNAGVHGGSNIGSDYLDNELKAVINLALASSGARQILTIITQLFWAPAGSLLMIEEPEISLHPKAQIDVLEMFAEAIKEQKQIIVTTHSIFMLQALGYAVLKGWLTRDQIIVHHVEKRKGGTTVTPLPLTKTGYIKNWVPSFSKVERQLLREWAKSLPRE